MNVFYEDCLGSYMNPLAGLNSRIRNNSILASAFKKEYCVKYDEHDLIQKIEATFPDGYGDWSILQRNQFLEMTTLLSGYLLSSQGDRMSLGHSVEGRYPFLDHRLVEKAFSWPDNYKLNGFSQKHVLRNSFRGLLPESIIDRPKLPYQAPDLKAFIHEGRFAPVVEEFLSVDKIREYGVFDERFIARFLKRSSERTLDRLGYRENMTIVFLLSAQISLYWARHPRRDELDKRLCMVDITDQIEMN